MLILSWRSAGGGAAARRAGVPLCLRRRRRSTTWVQLLCATVRTAWNQHLRPVTTGPIRPLLPRRTVGVLTIARTILPSGDPRLRRITLTHRGEHGVPLPPAQFDHEHRSRTLRRGLQQSIRSGVNSATAGWARPCNDDAAGATLRPPAAAQQRRGIRGFRRRVQQRPGARQWTAWQH